MFLKRNQHLFIIKYTCTTNTSIAITLLQLYLTSYTLKNIVIYLYPLFLRAYQIIGLERRRSHMIQLKGC